MYKEATYDYDILEGFLFIEDRNEKDTISVTNDMESVLKKIKEEIGDEINDLKCIYKDGSGNWDGVKFRFNEEGEAIITSFVMLNETELEKAVDKYLEENPDKEEEKGGNFLFNV